VQPPRSAAAVAAALLAVLAVARATAAQEAGTAPARSPALPPASGSLATTAAPSDGAAARLPTELAPTEWRAKKLIGADVYGPHNKPVGNVGDLIVDLSGRVTAFVVSVGGFLGIGTRHVAVPTSDVKIGEDGRLTVNLTQDQLERAPEFDFGERAATRAGPMAAPSGISSAPR
jgi:sporulation protein YlmC with PRC-barrel domain